jgi:hypothetical protein
VARPELLKRLKRAVLARGGARAVAVTSQGRNKRKVWGMGGVGKTTLAKMLMHDEDVRARFRDGVAWVVLGNEAFSLTARQEDVYFDLVGQRPNPPFKDETQGLKVLKQALAGKACLLVVDDVWVKKHAAAFVCVGPEGVLLVTSRFDGVVSTPPEACVKVDVLQPPDGGAAMAVLRRYARDDEEKGEDDSEGVGKSKMGAVRDAGDEEEEEEEEGVMRAVLRRCGGLPLAIAIAGSLKREPRWTWGKVLDKMRQHGGRALQLERWSEEYPHEGLWEALGASVAHLKATRPEEYECLLWYGAFREDTWMPLEVVRRVWGVDECDAIQVARSLAGRSLVELDVEGGWRSQAHDLLRDFLQAEAREAMVEEGGRGMHGAIVRRGMQACERVEWGTTYEPYFGSGGAAWHLQESGEAEVSLSGRP